MIEYMIFVAFSMLAMFGLGALTMYVVLKPQRTTEDGRRRLNYKLN